MSDEEITVAAAAEGDDELVLLKAMRVRLAGAVDNCPTRDLSALTRRLQDVNKEIRALEEIRAKETKDREAGNGDSGSRSGWNPADDL